MEALRLSQPPPQSEARRTRATHPGTTRRLPDPKNQKSFESARRGVIDKLFKVMFICFVLRKTLNPQTILSAPLTLDFILIDQ